MKVFFTVIEGLNCRAPSDLALQIQCRILGNIPVALIDKAGQHVLATHVYPDAPRPGVFLEAIEEEWAEMRQIREWFRFCLDRYEWKKRMEDKNRGTHRDEPGEDEGSRMGRGGRP